MIIPSLFAFFILTALTEAHGEHLRGGASHHHHRINSAHHHHHNHDEEHDHHDHRDLKQQDNTPHSCGTRDMTEQDKAAQEKVQTLAKLKQQKRERQRGRISSDYQANTPKVIPVCFHLIGLGVSRRRIQKDLDALNKAFSSQSCCDPSLDWCNGECSEPQTNIRFAMARSFFGITLRGTARSPLSIFSCVRRRWRSADMAVDFTEYDIKRQMRMGQGEILNVYYSDLGEGLLGFAYYPNILETNPVVDGVVIHRDSRVGGSFSNYAEGDTLVHEVGHWLGLPHTFAGGCNPGNGISDIPPQREPNHGCAPLESIPDTCPDQPGVDSIFNFMDYSYDKCLFQWSQGQIDVMHANIEYYRQGETREFASVELTLGEYSAPFDLVQGSSRDFYLNIPTESEVVCKLHGHGGDADLFVKWEGEGGYDCAADGPLSSETCFLKRKSGKANLLVTAGATIVDSTILCSLRTTATSPGVELLTGVADVSTGAAQGVFRPYTLSLRDMNIFEIHGMLECHASGTDSADIDLYMGMRDNVERAACVSQQPGTTAESCRVTPGDSDMAYIWLFYAEGATQEDVTLECNLIPFEATQLTSGVPSLPHTLPIGHARHFYVETLSPSTVICNTHTTDGNGNVDLLMGVNTPSRFECVSDNYDSLESCAVQLGPGYVFIETPALEETSDFTVTCSVQETQTTELESGVEVSGLDLVRGEYAYFQIDVPTTSIVSCTTTADNGDIDLFLNWDGSHVYECMSNSPDSEESCSMGTSSGTAYAIVSAYTDTSGFSISCDVI